MIFTETKILKPSDLSLNTKPILMALPTAESHLAKSHNLKQTTFWQFLRLGLNLNEKTAITLV